MNFFKIFSEKCHENGLTNQLVGEQVDVQMFLIDDIADVFDVPKYNEYDNDYAVNYDVDFLEKPYACSLLENDPSQQFKESIQSVYDSYAIEYEENSVLVEGNPLPLCFASFELLKEDFKIINKIEECKPMQNHHS